MAQRIRRYKCTNVLDHQNDSEVLRMADTGDECPPLHSLDSFDERIDPRAPVTGVNGAPAPARIFLLEVETFGRTSSAEAVMSS